ncbi:Ribonuclease E [Candidatus Filomicrobium marinum]|uniref:Ribonuclease E n=1 Tax=Candidatus Filomicrobium marinum TaxID=1608628 RepID=A0A0D6JAI2_9HYPH|nr:ribonuclease E/G [Candidatus Filomicrobium marinum]CFW97511.1 Ribonuclease E [Candidatus Filomicrobium marinum]CPR14684.1 Ribonuclease E [Candidatus Filomicrobium marinum]
MSENKMLIDAAHPEETRVVVLRGGRVEEFDYESAARKQLRGNIYLAKVTRVEPALQAAFVDYGGNRHGFLAFNEIHPDYYQIPIADRIALLEEEAAIEAEEEAEADARAERMAARRARRQNATPSKDSDNDDDNNTNDESDEAEDVHAASSDDHDWDNDGEDGDNEASVADDADAVTADETSEEAVQAESVGSKDDPVDPPSDEDSGQQNGPKTIAINMARDESLSEELATEGDSESSDRTEVLVDADVAEALTATVSEARPNTEVDASPAAPEEAEETAPADDDTDGDTTTASADTDAIENVGDSEDALEELPSRPRRSRRSYKIQEVIKRRQVLLIQVVKEERGNKGAALTTYLSLAGRYTVLMPNTARGGGISRKITNPQDRKRLKAIATELEVPEGMGLIIRTAGAARTKQEIRRDFEYLLRLWESVRELTLQSTAPSLVYEEGDLIKRSIRDLYNKEIDEVVVAGEDAHREAKSFMRMLMPSHAKNVTLYKDAEPLFTRYAIERQLNAMFSPFVTLRSGGYLVINQTEALVAVDVNSGRSTREFSIEETALHTNLEAADEIARHLKLRDLAGLIVIDFIDMEEKRNNRAVERRLKEALRLDRARIQVGRISPFGLLEMSRQRLRTGVLEGSTSQCPHCQGTGIIRSTESIALAVLRALEDAVMNKSRGSLIANTTAEVALYILNNKRDFIIDMEARHGFPILVQASEKMAGANFTVEKGSAPAQAPTPRRADRSAVKMDWNFDEAEVVTEASDNFDNEDGNDEATGSGEEDNGRRKRRRRRRTRRGGSERLANAADTSASENLVEASDDMDEDEQDTSTSDDGEASDDTTIESADGSSERPSRRRRRGRRGGRRNRERNRTTAEGEGEHSDGTQDAASEIPGLGPQPSIIEISTEPRAEAEPTPVREKAEPSSETVMRVTEPASETVEAVIPPAELQQSVTEEVTTETQNEPAASVQAPETTPPVEAEAPVATKDKPVPVVAAEEPRAPESTPAPNGGLRLQRVIMGPDRSVETGLDATLEPSEDKPARKGWWQRKLLGSDS